MKMTESSEFVKLIIRRQLTGTKIERQLINSSRWRQQQIGSYSSNVVFTKVRIFFAEREKRYRFKFAKCRAHQCIHGMATAQSFDGHRRRVGRVGVVEHSSCFLYVRLVRIAQI